MSKRRPISLSGNIQQWSRVESYVFDDGQIIHDNPQVALTIILTVISSARDWQPTEAFVRIDDNNQNLDFKGHPRKAWVKNTYSYSPLDGEVDIHYSLPPDELEELIGRLSRNKADLLDIELAERVYGAGSVVGVKVY